MIKKIVPFILILSLIIAQTTYAGANIKEETKKVDSLSVALGIVENGDDSSNVTRGEMATVVMKLIGVDTKIMVSEQNPFTDVSASDANYNSIIYANQLGIINGTTPTTFEPNEIVTYEQALKMMVSTLGYDGIAKSNGDYPFGYVKTALNIGLLKSVSGNEMNLGMLKIITENALKVDLFKVSYGSVKLSQIVEGKNLINSVFKLEEYEGVVTGTPLCRITTFSGIVDEGEVMINDTLFLTDSNDIYELAGYKVKFWVPIDDDAPKTIVFAKPLKNEAKQINSKYIKSLSVTRTNATISYNEDESGKNTLKETISLRDTKAIFNNVFTDITIDTEKLLQPKNGNLILLDNDANGDIDYVFINSYDTVVASHYSEHKKTLNFVYPVSLGGSNNKSDSVILDEDESTIIKDFGFETIKENDVLHIYSSKSKEIITLQLVRKSLNVTIDGMSENGDVKEITCGDKTYELAKEWVDTNKKINIGSEANLYFGADGKVAYIKDFSENDQVYGFVTNAKTMPGIEGKTQIRVFTQNGNFDTFELKDKLNVVDENGLKSKIPSSQILDKFATESRTESLYKDNFKNIANGTPLTKELIGAYSVTGNLGIVELDTNHKDRLGIGTIPPSGRGSVVFELNSKSSAGFEKLVLGINGRIIGASTITVSVSNDPNGAYRVVKDYTVLGGDDVITLENEIKGEGKVYVKFDLYVENHQTWGFIEKLNFNELVKTTEKVFDVGKMQLIRFKLDRNKTITEIEFAKSPATSEAERQMEIDNKIFAKGNVKKSEFYYIWPKMFLDTNKNPLFAVPPTTLTFFIPGDPAMNPPSLADEKLYTIGEFNRKEGDYVIESYNLGKLNEAEVLVVYATADKRGAYDYMTNYSVIENVSKSLNKLGESILTCTVSLNGAQAKYSTPEDSDVLINKVTGKPFKSGDIVQIGSVTAGELEFVNSIFMYDKTSPNGCGYTYSDPINETLNKNDNLPAYGSHTAELRIASGTVVDRSDDYIKIANNKGETMIFYLSTGCLVMDYKGDRVQPQTKGTDKNAIKKGDYVVLRVRWSIVDQIVRYTAE